jgi:hypothetical protein
MTPTTPTATPIQKRVSVNTSAFPSFIPAR